MTTIEELEDRVWKIEMRWELIKTGILIGGASITGLIVGFLAGR
jgi:hypothetical protein